MEREGMQASILFLDLVVAHDVENSGDKGFNEEIGESLLLS